MKKAILLYYRKVREQLWFRPLLFCLFSIAGALVARQADGTQLHDIVPEIKAESIGDLLDTISASMLVISIFAVASMLAAFSAASSTATPRSFKIVVTDDVSQNALSIYIGAFIFSIVGTVALDNGFYGKSGRFVLFILTLILFAAVILTFLRWVDRIARLGRLSHTIAQVESVVAKTLTAYIKSPTLNALPLTSYLSGSQAIISNAVGYVQHINLESLQAFARENDLKIQLNCIPGKFVNKNSPIAFLSSLKALEMKSVSEKICKSIVIGDTRLFDEDPRFGIIAMTEIASRALSPGINDPGTAIQIISSHVRLFFLWKDAGKSRESDNILYDRIEVPTISMEDFFNDAFRPISRDGADNIEVMLRLQRALSALATIEQADIKEAAIQCSRQAYERAQSAIEYKPDLAVLKEQCLFNATAQG